VVKQYQLGSPINKTNRKFCLKLIQDNDTPSLSSAQVKKGKELARPSSVDFLKTTSSKLNALFQGY